VGGAEDEEVGGAQRVEMRFVTREEEEAGQGSDITALVLPYRHGYRKASVFLCVCVVVVVFVIGKHTHTHTHAFFH